MGIFGLLAPMGQTLMPNDNDGDLAQLRDRHAEMNKAVAVYEWDDLDLRQAASTRRRGGKCWRAC